MTDASRDEPRATLEPVTPTSPLYHRIRGALALWKRLTGPLYWLYEGRLEQSVRHGPLPKHIGLIMDGNRRFAKTTGLGVTAGHD